MARKPKTTTKVVTKKEEVKLEVKETKQHKVYEGSLAGEYFVEGHEEHIIAASLEEATMRAKELGWIK